MICQTSRAACRVQATGVFSPASSRSCGQARHGVICRSATDLRQPATTLCTLATSWRLGPKMEALAAAHDKTVKMIDYIRSAVHQHGACIAGNREQHIGRSSGGLTSKVHAVVDSNGLPVRLGLSPVEAHHNKLCPERLAGLQLKTMVLAERGYDANWIRALVGEQGAWANIPPKRNRRNPICFSPYLYRSRHLVERFFNRIKQCRRIALGMTARSKLPCLHQLASIRIWLKNNESTL